MELTDKQDNCYTIEGVGIENGTKSNTDMWLSTVNVNTLSTSVEDECLRSEHTQLEKEKSNGKTFCIQWVEKNNIYDENCNVMNQVLIKNCSIQTLERYLDFLVNGHFLTGMLPITKTVANMNLYKECPKCGKKLKRISFRRHYSNCGKEPNLQCDYCPFKTKHKRSLGNHIILLHSDVTRPPKNECLICSGCDKKLHSKKSLEIHGYYCKHPDFVHCNDCSYYTKQKYNLMRHIESTHSSLYSVACPKCGKRLKNRNTLYAHLSYCGKEPHLHCNICSYKTKFKKDLTLHCTRVHSNVGKVYSD